MQASFVVSVVLHAAILVAAIVGLPAPEEYEVKVAEAIPVEVLTVAELTRLQAQQKDAKPTEKPGPKAEPEQKADPKPAPKQEKVAAAPPEPAPPEPAPPEPEPVATPAPPQVQREETKAKAKPEPEPAPKDPEPKPEEKAEVKPVPKPRVRPKPPAPKNKFDADKIAALLNKIPDENKQRIDPAPSEDTSPAPGDLASLRGSDSIITLDEKDALRQQIERCWVPPVGAMGADDLLIKLKISLKPDGSLQGPPVLMNSGGSQYFQVAAESAMRAVRRCEPYSLPPEKYGAWKEIILNFDPSQMFRG